MENYAQQNSAYGDCSPDKEYFRQPPEPTYIQQEPIEVNDQGILNEMNEDFCFHCKKEGDLMCCDNCPRTYHNSSDCINPAFLEMIDDQHWLCPCCRLREVCPICSKVVEEKPQIICALCSRFVHLECTKIPKCLIRVHIVSNENALLVVCLDCVGRSGIRQWISKSSDSKYCLVSPLHYSIIHKTWIPQESFNQILTSQTYRPNKISHTDIAKWSTIEKIILVKAPISQKTKTEVGKFNKLTDPMRYQTYGSADNFKFLVRWCGVKAPTWEDEVVVQSYRTVYLKFLKQWATELIANGGDQGILRKVCINTQDSSIETEEFAWCNSFKKEVLLISGEDPYKLKKRQDLLKIVDNIVKDSPNPKKLTSHQEVVIFTDNIDEWDDILRESTSYTIVTKLQKDQSTFQLAFQYELCIGKTTNPSFNVLLTNSNIFYQNRQILTKKIQMKCQMLIFDEEPQMQGYPLEKLELLKSCALVLFNYSEKKYELYYKIFGQYFTAKVQRKQKMPEAQVCFLEAQQNHFQIEIERAQEDPADELLELLRKKSETPKKSQPPEQTIVPQQKPMIQVVTKKRAITGPIISIKSLVRQKKNTSPKKTSNNEMNDLRSLTSYAYIYKQFSRAPWQALRKFKLSEGERVCLLGFVIAYGFNYKRAELQSKILAYDVKGLFQGKIASEKLVQIAKYLQLLFAITISDKNMGIHSNYITHIFHGFNHRSLAKHFIDLNILQTLYAKYKDSPKRWPHNRTFIIQVKKNIDNTAAKNWNEQDDLELVRLVLLLGYGNWNTIAHSFMHNSQQAGPKGVEYLIKRMNPTFKPIQAYNQMNFCAANLCNRLESILLEGEKYID